MIRLAHAATYADDDDNWMDDLMTEPLPWWFYNGDLPEHQARERERLREQMRVLERAGCDAMNCAQHVVRRGTCRRARSRDPYRIRTRGGGRIISWPV